MTLLGFAGRHDAPQGLHLLAAVLPLHFGIVERVAALDAFGGPQNRLGGVGEVAAGEVRRRVDLVPGDVVQNLVIQHLQGVADAVDVVRRSRDPHCAVGLEQAAALIEPEQVEVVVADDPRAFVPAAFVHADHAAPDAGNPAVGQKVRRVGEDHVDRLVGHPAQKLQRVGLVQPQGVVGTGVIGRRRVRVAGAGFLHRGGGV